MTIYKFDTFIKKHDGKDATYIEVPYDIEKDFGVKRLKVKVKFDDVEYRGSIVRMGMPCYMIGITKEIRNKLGKTYGDIISVQIEKDEEERIVKLPLEFEEILKVNELAYEFYNSLSYSQKRKYMLWITSARKEETKKKRMNDALIKLEGKIKI